MSGNADRPAGAPPGKEPDPETVEHALTMLVEGKTLTEVAETFGVARKTVRFWRDRPAGQKRTAELRADRAGFFRDAVESNRKRLRALLGQAVETLAESLDSTVPFEALTAAQAILDRTGLPKTTVVEQTEKPELDLGKLTADEAAELERLYEKARVDADGG